MTDKQTTVLIVDDSAHARELLANIVRSESSFQIIGMAENGAEAIQMAGERHPDVIIMDLMMPKRNGFEATKEIMSRTPTRIIAVSGVFNKEEITQGFQALDAGALTIIEKPKWISEEQYLDTSRFIVETIKALTEVKVQSSFTKKVQDYAAPLTMKGDKEASVIGIGASLGGPSALFYVLSKLPAAYPIPIVVYQQIPAQLMHGLAEWLNGATPLTVTVATNGEKFLPCHVYLQQEDTFLQVDKRGVITLTEMKGSPKKFPIDLLFKSMAIAYGEKSAAILFKGIGNDGDAGIEALKAMGATTLVHNTSGQQTVLNEGAERATPMNHASYDDIVFVLKQLHAPLS